MMGAVWSADVGLAARNEEAFCVEYGRDGRSRTGRTRPLTNWAPLWATKGGKKCLANSPAVNSWPAPPPAQRSDVQISGAGTRAGGALQTRPAHHQDRPAGARRHPDGTGHRHVPEGEKLHLRRPQGRVHLGRLRRHACRHQDQGAGTDRARQGRHHRRPARGFRAAGDHRLYPAAENAMPQPRRRRGHDATPSESVFPARIGDLGTGHASDGGFCRQGIEAQAHDHDLGGLRLRLRADGRLPADLRG